MAKRPAPSPSPLPEPIVIHVLWHPTADPKQSVASDYAREIFHWFRMKTGYGAPVVYHSTPAPGRTDLPLDLPPPADGVLHLVTILSTAEMVVDYAWRAWLEELAARPDCRLFPVALEPSAYNLPESVRQLNFMSVQPARGRGTEFTADDRAAGRERLLKQLTEAFARVVLRGHGEAMAAAAKIRVFLSHAKADDTVQARALRDYLYGETQLSAFFDENDIAFGHGFADVLHQAISQGETAALAVFHGDHYAERTWCRREIQVFRTPLAADGQGHVWKLHPMIVLQTMQGRVSDGSTPGRTIAELGSAPCLRWQEECRSHYVTSLLREIFLSARHLEMAQALEIRLLEKNPREAARDWAVINWSPDLPTLQRLSELIRTQRDDTVLRRVIYPGYGLSRLELDTLRLYLPQLTLETFAEAAL